MALTSNFQAIFNKISNRDAFLHHRRASFFISQKSVISLHAVFVARLSAANIQIFTKQNKSYTSGT